MRKVLYSILILSSTIFVLSLLPFIYMIIRMIGGIIFLFGTFGDPMNLLETPKWFDSYYILIFIIGALSLVISIMCFIFIVIEMVIRSNRVDKSENIDNTLKKKTKHVNLSFIVKVFLNSSFEENRSIKKQIEKKKYKYPMLVFKIIDKDNENVKNYINLVENDKVLFRRTNIIGTFEVNDIFKEIDKLIKNDIEKNKK